MTNIEQDILDQNRDLEAKNQENIEKIRSPRLESGQNILAD